MRSPLPHALSSRVLCCNPTGVKAARHRCRQDSRAALLRTAEELHRQTVRIAEEGALLVSLPGLAMLAQQAPLRQCCLSSTSSAYVGLARTAEVFATSGQQSA